MATRLGHVGAPRIHPMPLDQIAPKRAAIEQHVHLRGEGRDVLVILQHRYVHRGLVRVLATEGLDQFVVLETDMARTGIQPRRERLVQRMRMQHAADFGNAFVQLRMQQGLGRRTLCRRDRLAIEVHDHDVVFGQPALVAARYGDRGVPVVQPHREIAAGRRRPAERSELAHVVGNRTGGITQAGGVVGQGGHWDSLANAIHQSAD